MRSYEFIEMYKEKNNLGSDYRVSKELGVTRQSISLYKNGRPIDEDLALPIAESLGIEPSKILYIIAGEKSRKPEAKKAWDKLSRQAGMISLKALLVLPLLALASIEYILC